MNRFEKLRGWISEREGKLFSARSLSELLGFSPTMYGRLERGDSQPSARMAEVLNKRYGISKAWFLSEEGEPPWRESEWKATWQELDEFRERAVQEGGDTAAAKTFARFHVISRLNGSPQEKLLDWMELAARDPRFRDYLYMIINAAGGAYQKLNEFHEVDAPEDSIVTAGGGQKSEPTFEPTGVVLQFPEKPANLDPEESTRWDRNELALRRWEKTGKAFDVPVWAVGRFCREVAGFFNGAKLDDIGGLLKDIIEEGKAK